MCRYVILFLFVLLAALMVAAAVVVQQYGWVGLLVLFGALLVMGYVVRKALPYFIVHLATRPLRQMGAALRGGRIVVHVVEPCDPPEGYDLDPPDVPEAIADDWDDEEPDEGGPEPDDPFDWYRIVLNVVPPGDDETSEGRIVVRQAWSPQMIGAVGPRPPTGPSWLPHQVTPDVRNAPVLVWTGSDYELAGEMLYGERRLMLRIGVTRAVRAVTIVYAQFTELGIVPLPIIDVSPGGGG